MDLDLRVGDSLTLAVDDLNSEGWGVARYKGFVLFVEGALIGEKVLARVTAIKKGFGKAKTLSIKESSPSRVKPLCPLFGKCGGCQIMHLAYADQLVAKQRLVESAISKQPSLKSVPVANCVAGDHPFHYRNKLQLHVVHNELAMSGFRTHERVPMQACFIHSKCGEEILDGLRPLLKELQGVKRIIVRTTSLGSAALVFEGGNKDKLRHVAKTLAMQDKRLQSIVYQKSAHTKPALLYGTDFIQEELFGTPYVLSPTAFFQVNTQQAEKLYSLALQAACLRENDQVVDLYCGVGSLSCQIGKKVARVTGVELSAAAIHAARQNGLRNCHFIEGDVEVVAPQLERADVVFVNPPRAGCKRSVIGAIVNLQPRSIVYISCQPATLARDLGLFAQLGYLTECIQPIDLFPQTMHVESVATLTNPSLEIPAKGSNANPLVG